MALFAVATALQLQFAEQNFAANPGAGIDVKGAGTSVLKDGFTSVDCLQDEMYETGDKYGENKHGYTNNFGVSIVRYSDVVEREQKKDMIPQVCFDFCRTIDDMHFFGLRNGRECYCTPYYERKTSGGGACSLPCEGDHGQICGGQEMSSVFEMHMCDSTKEDVTAVATAADTAYSLANGAGTWGQSAAADFEKAANAIMLEANRIGDMSSHDLAQQMKVHAGTVLHAAEEASATALELKTALDSLKALKDKDFTLPDNAYEAEEGIRTVQKLAATATADGAASEAINMAFMPPIDAEHAMEGANIFVSVIDMIKKWQGDHEKLTDTPGRHILEPTTCQGATAAEPIVGLSMEQCAEACNTLAPQSADNYCVAFQHFYVAGMDVSPPKTVEGVSHLAQGICQLFSSVEHVYKYDCGESEEHACEDVDYKLLGIERPCSDDTLGCSTRMCYSLANNPNFAGGMMWKYRNSFGKNVGRDFQTEWGLKESDPGFWEGCCAMKELYPDGMQPTLLELANTTKALLSKSSKQSASVKDGPVDPGRFQLELQAPPKGLWGISNACKVRASWMIAAPQKPDYEELNTCLDTGKLVMP